MSKLSGLVADNFAAFFVAHVAHLQAKGPNFVSDHAIFQEVYESLYGWHDQLAEQLMICGEQYMFKGVKDVAEDTIVVDIKGVFRDDLFRVVVDNLKTLEKCANECYHGKQSEDDAGLETMLGDYAKDVSKLRWKLMKAM